METNKKLNRLWEKKIFFFKTQKNRVCFLHIHVSGVFFKDKKIYKMQELHHHIMLRVLTNYFKPYKAAYQLKGTLNTELLSSLKKLFCRNP